MKPDSNLFLLRAQRAALIVLLCVVTLSVKAGSFYIVVASFTEAPRADKFAVSLRGVFPDAAAHYDAERKLYHVRVAQTGHLRSAGVLRDDLRARGFFHAWIYSDFALSGAPTGDSPPAEEAEGYARLELYTGAAVLLGSTDNDYISISKDRQDIRRSAGENAGFACTFMAQTASGHPINGRVTLLDQRGAVISMFKTGESIAFGGRQRQMTFVCEAAGYAPETKVVDFSGPTGGALQRDKDGIWTLRFTPAPLKVDAFSFVYADLFHPETSLLTDSAEMQLSALRSLMAFDCGWGLEINTHCNAGGKRAIRVPGKGGNLFDVATSEVRQGTDKSLTRARAETLRDFLAGAGIDTRRITVMGWGSYHPVARSTSDHAALNERVEISLISGAHDVTCP